MCAMYNGKCLRCSQAKPLTVDHVMPLSMGGTNDIANIQPLCHACNASKGTRTIDYREAVRDG
jgi:5-methylcytosine-specific restriction endonuclease McrA